MGERPDRLTVTTLFKVRCPRCGDVGRGRWADRDRDIVRCQRCGHAFAAHENTWRPVTGGMTDEELVERRRMRQRESYARRAAGINARRRERYAGDPAYRERVRELSNDRARRLSARRRAERLERARRTWEETRMGKRDTLGDLTDHLFAELERLGDESLTPEQLETEIERSKAISSIAQTVINNANVVLKAAMFQDEMMDADAKLPRMLTEGGD